jgi:ankyrin repeat protein
MYADERSATVTGGRGPQGQTPLMVAAESGSLEELQRLLSSGMALEHRDELNHTALTYAARRGRDAHVEALMRAGADARTRGLWDSSGGSMTALDAALLEGATHTAGLIEREVLQGFLALEAPDLSAVDEAGETPLHWVARYADARAAQLLVQGGADLETQSCPARTGDERGIHKDDLRAATPLLVAVWAGNVGVARQLLESQADARAVDERGRGAFHVMRHPESVALSAALLRGGADPTLPDRDGKTPAQVLSESGLRAELARALASLGRPMPSAPVTIADVMGVITRLGTPRGTAAREDDPASVLAILGGDAMLVNETDARGRTALSEAAFHGLPRVVEALVARGARLDARDHTGATPLHRARDAQTVAVLVRLGANVDARDQSGATPLHLRAAAPGALEAVAALVDAGANARLEDRGGRTPLDLARRAGNAEVIDYLDGRAP